MILVPKRDLFEEGILIAKKGKEYPVLKEFDNQFLIIDETNEEDLISLEYLEKNFLKLNNGDNLEIEILKEDVVDLFDNLRGKEHLLQLTEANELKSLLKDLTTFLEKIGQN